MVLVEYLLDILRRILHTTPRGAAIRVHDFRTPALASRLLDALRHKGLLLRHDADAWKKTPTQEPAPRRYTASVDLQLPGLLDTGHVRTARDYLQDKQIHLKMSRPGRVVLHEKSGVEIPGNVVESLRNGTGYRVDFERALEIFNRAYTVDEKPDKLMATRQAVGAGAGAGSINPTWIQKHFGDVYSTWPNIQGLPKELRAALVSIDGAGLWCVDYTACHPHIALIMAGYRLADVSVYDVLADETGLPLDRVKDVLRPYLRGQTRGQFVWGKPDKTPGERRELADAHDLLLAALRATFPDVVDLVPAMQTPERQYDFERQTAAILFRCIGNGLEETGCSWCGIPLHDGWIFHAASERPAERVHAIFESGSEHVLGVPIPATLRRVS